MEEPLPGTAAKNLKESGGVCLAVAGTVVPRSLSSGNSSENLNWGRSCRLLMLVNAAVALVSSAGDSFIVVNAALSPPSSDALSSSLPPLLLPLSFSKQEKRVPDALSIFYHAFQLVTLSI